MAASTLRRTGAGYGNSACPRSSMPCPFFWDEVARVGRPRGLLLDCGLLNRTRATLTPAADAPLIPPETIILWPRPWLRLRPPPKALQTALARRIPRAGGRAG